MNNFDEQLKILNKIFKQLKVKYVIIGGVAVSMYGEPRFTEDIDVNVLLDKNKIGEFLKKAKEYHFIPLYPQAKKIAQQSGVIPLKFVKGREIGRCDIIIAENALEYAAIKRGRVKQINSVRMRLISIEDLLVQKMTSIRPRDREDVRNILRRQKNKVDNSYVMEWLKKIDAIDKTLKLVKNYNELSEECC